MAYNDAKAASKAYSPRAIPHKAQLRCQTDALYSSFRTAKGRPMASSKTPARDIHGTVCGAF